VLVPDLQHQGDLGFGEPCPVEVSDLGGLGHSGGGDDGVDGVDRGGGGGGDGLGHLVSPIYGKGTISLFPTYNYIITQPHFIYYRKKPEKPGFFRKARNFPKRIVFGKNFPGFIFGCPEL
jgi:hypothetical protein